MQEMEKYPEGHFVGMWIGIGIALFAGLGVPLAIATGNLGLMGIGPALGVTVGVAIGQGIENKYRKEGQIRPLTSEERRRRRTVVTAGVIVVLMGVILFLSLFLLQLRESACPEITCLTLRRF
jgi:hypothetical protein